MKKAKYIEKTKLISNSQYIIIPQIIREELKLMTGDRLEIIISKPIITEDGVDVLGHKNIKRAKIIDRLKRMTRSRGLFLPKYLCRKMNIDLGDKLELIVYKSKVNKKDLEIKNTDIKGRK